MTSVWAALCSMLHPTPCCWEILGPSVPLGFSGGTVCPDAPALKPPTERGEMKLSLWIKLLGREGAIETCGRMIADLCSLLCALGFRFHDNLRLAGTVTVYSYQSL